MSPTDVDERKRLVEGSRRLGLTLAEAATTKLLQLLDELARWNRAYNLTSIVRRDEMLTKHLLDSLSVAPYLIGRRIADAGTGAGFPGLPLAIVNSDVAFTLIDSNQKKISFVNHAARALELQNVEAIHARVETLPFAQVQAQTIVARALAPLGRLLQDVATLAGPETQVLAMKAHVTEGELASVGRDWRVEATHPLFVPDLNEARCVVVARRA